MVVWNFMTASKPPSSPIEGFPARLETEREHAIADGDGRRPRPDHCGDIHPATALRGVVRWAWLGGPLAPAGDGGEGEGRATRPADRANRRRQNPGRLPAQPDRAVGA